MTTFLETRIQRFIGVSTDDKPTAPPEGSTFHAVDTGEQWVFHDDMWELDLRLARSVKQAAAL